MRHLFKSQFRQCDCLWCGSGPGRRTLECPMVEPMRAAVCQFAADHGRTWKSQLSTAWANNVDLGPCLRRVRNTIGPSQLRKISQRMLTNARAEEEGED